MKITFKTLWGLHICFIFTETWLTEDVDNDRATGRGGGVLIAVRSFLFSSVKPVAVNYNLELVACEVVSPRAKFLLCACYRTPNSSTAWLELFNKLLEENCEKYDNIVIGGDFNLSKAKLTGKF